MNVNLEPDKLGDEDAQTGSSDHRGAQSPYWQSYSPVRMSALRGISDEICSI